MGRIASMHEAAVLCDLRLGGGPPPHPQAFHTVLGLGLSGGLWT